LEDLIKAVKSMEITPNKISNSNKIKESDEVCIITKTYTITKRYVYRNSKPVNKIVTTGISIIIKTNTSLKNNFLFRIV